MRLSEIAKKLDARLEISADGASSASELNITGVAGIVEASPGQLSFVINPKYASAARTTSASALIVDEKFPEISTPTLRCKNPHLAFARAVELFHPLPVYPPGVHPTAVIDASAKLGARASVGAYVVVGPGAQIGDDCVLLPHVVIYPGARIGDRFFAHAHAVVREHCQLGDDIILQNGVIIGSDGYGFAKDDSGHWYKIVQAGAVVIEDAVEVQANSCIDRPSVGETRIRRGVKVDNLVQVGHGSQVGEDSMLCAQVGLAGSTHIGKNVILAGQVGVAGHCHVGDGAVATAQSGIPNDVKAGEMVSGYPAIENRRWLRCVAIFNKLPELARNMRPSQAAAEKSQ